MSCIRNTDIKAQRISCDPVFSPLISEIPEDCQDLVKEVNFQERFKDKARLFLKIKKSLLSIFKKSNISKITLKLNWLIFSPKHIAIAENGEKYIKIFVSRILVYSTIY
jgi:hypothetical protein